jgi:hypothetical protein
MPWYTMVYHGRARALQCIAQRARSNPRPCIVPRVRSSISFGTLAEPLGTVKVALRNLSSSLKLTVGSVARSQMTLRRRAFNSCVYAAQASCRLFFQWYHHLLTPILIRKATVLELRLVATPAGSLVHGPCGLVLACYNYRLPIERLPIPSLAVLALSAAADSFVFHGHDTAMKLQWHAH